MARPTPAPQKEPGRLKQMAQVFRMTIRRDRASLPILLVSFLGPALLGVALAILLSSDNWIGIVLYSVTGVLAGLLVFLVVLGRRAERAAYTQIAGQPGAAGAVIQNSLRGGWTGSEMPVAVNPKTQDAVFRVVGRGGVALIAEGPTVRTHRLVDEQRRNIARVLPNVPVHVLQVGPDAGSVPLHRISAELRKFKKVLRKAEVRAAANRLESLNRAANLPIPKGVDPTKVRVPRPR